MMLSMFAPQPSFFIRSGWDDEEAALTAAAARLSIPPVSFLRLVNNTNACSSSGATFLRPRGCAFTRNRPVCRRNNNQEQPSPSPCRLRPTVSFFRAPKFSTQETPTSFEVRACLPAFKKENISVNFTDPQTLVVGGSVKRPGLHTETASVGDAGKEKEKEKGQTQEQEVVPENEEKATQPEQPQNPQEPEDADVGNHDHQASVSEVDDAGEEIWLDIEHASHPTSLAIPSPPPNPQQQQQQPSPHLHEKDNAQHPANPPSSSSFSHTFRFPSPVDYDNVSASLDENKVLCISVPKVKDEEEEDTFATRVFFL